MDVQFGPNSADEPNLLYKLQRKIKVFNTTNPLANRGYDLVASSSKYGLVFVASPDGILSVYYTQQITDKDCESPSHLDVHLQEKPTHISVSCDHELLAVTGGQIISVFQIVNFNNQNVKPSIFMKTDISPNAVVSAVQWNPCISDTIALAFNDGTLLVAQVNNAQVKKVQAKARCICWSPKGKQLVVGNSDGTLCQYKPDLSPMKMIPAPNIFDGAPVEAIAIYWISTYQFAVVYRNAGDNSRPAVAIVNTPKGGQAACLNYEDICYSMGSSRPWYYYLIGIPQWNIILAASSNSMEIATMGSSDGANWCQWTQSDEARPELPLTDKKEENYPVGVCIDTSAVHQLPWGENEQLPFMPHVLVLSQSGLLAAFAAVSLRPAAPQLCAPPQQIALPAAAMTNVIPGAEPAPTPAPVPVQTAAQRKQEPPPAYTQPAPPHQPANQGAAPTQSVKPTAFTQQPSHGFQALSAVPSQAQEANGSVPVPIVVPTPQQAQTTKPTTPAQKRTTTQSQTPEVNAALKADQERANMLKANEELRSMLVKEVNDFQTALYKFRVKTRELQIQMQNDLNSLEAPFDLQSLDTEKLRKECSLEELRGAIIQQKLELVRACAVVAEARSHSEAKDHQWTQADPLSVKRLASVKKLAYYVENQLQQAHKALDYKWNEIADKDAQFNKPGSQMTIPLLDAVYQPLVRQQGVLARQAAALRQLQARAAAAAPAAAPGLLRSTPLKRDPLSKLTKNILNMSIEPKDRPNLDGGLSNQKLEALRDMLSNHKTVKIKPVSMELSEHLAALRLSYERAVKEGVKLELTPVHVKDIKSETVKTEPVAGSSNLAPIIKQQQKEHKLEPINIPSYSPMTTGKPSNNGLASVARTLFTDEPKREPMLQTPTPQTPTQSKPFSFSLSIDNTSQVAKPTTSAFSIRSNNEMASEATKSVLKNLLMNKQSAEAANTFMGQKICSPSAFAAPTPNQSAGEFATKPTSEISAMISKYQTQPLTPSTKPEDLPKMKSLETGEPEDSGDVVIIEKKEGKGASFSVKNIPDLVMPNVTISKVEKKPEKCKENVQDKRETKAFSITLSQASSSVGTQGFATASANIVIPKPKATKPEAPKPEKSEAKTSAAATVVQTSSSSTPVKTTEPTTPPVESKTSSAFNSTTSSTGSLFSSTSSSTGSPFGAAVTQPASIFSSTNASAFGNASPSSIFASASQNTTTTTQSSVFGSATTQSIFGATKTPVSSSSLFGSATTSKTEAPSPASVFGSASANKTESPSPASVFASANKTESPSSASVFATANKTESASPASVFGSTTKTEPISPSSVFGSASKTEPVSPSSVFGAAKPETASPSSVFGSAAKTDAVSPASVFGSAAKSETSTTKSVFGSTSPQSVFGTANSTTGSVFGTTTTTSTSLFGTATTQSSIFSGPSSPQSSVFGSNAMQPVFGNQATTQSSIFGGSPATQTASVFGAATPTSPTSVFGAPATTQSSVFGSPPATTQSSIFGTSGTTSQPGSIFGSSTPATQASVFGTPTATQTGSIFGSTTPTTQASVFGGSPSTQASVFGSSSPASVFGAPATTSSSLFGESNMFASASISTTSASASGGSIFGGGSAFGGGSPSNVFGGKSTFGQASPSSSIFGGGASGNNLWAGGTTASTGFGSSPFGQQTSPAASTFGSGSFSAGAPGGAFGSPAPQTGSVFGTPPQQTAPAFGGSPSFGSKPAFGQPSGFGAAPAFGQPAGFGGGFGAPAAFGGGATFGGAPAFGSTSPGKVFGGAAPSFAAPTLSNATFESLAGQDTLSFGNLAQQSAARPAPAPAFNTSPSFTGWRG